MIILKNLDKELNGNAVLTDINLELSKGKVYGLQGKNGSGKTMLMRAVCGLIKPNGGYVEIDGKCLGKESAFPESVGCLIENPAFVPYYSGLKNLQILADIKGRIGRKDICLMMERVGLDPGEKKPFRKYSLGMKQRLGIACAFMEEPDIILLDEPFNALDTEGVEMLKNLLGEAKEKEATIIVACHDKEELELIADEIFVMENGKIMEQKIRKEGTCYEGIS